MAIPYAAYVVRNVPEAVAAELDRMREDKLLAADPLQLIEYFVEKLSAKPYVGDFDDLKQHHDAVLLGVTTDEVRITFTQPELAAAAELLSFQPSSGANIEFHVDRETGTLWFNTTVQRATQGDIDRALDNIRQLNRDAAGQASNLRTHVTNVVNDRVGKVQSAQAKRDEDLARARAAGVNLRRPEDAVTSGSSQRPLPPRGNQSPADSVGVGNTPTQVTATFRVIPDLARNEATIQILDELERSLRQLEDIGELSEEGLRILLDEALPLVKTVRALLSETVPSAEERKSLVRRTLVNVGRSVKVMAALGRTTGGLAGLSKAPQVIATASEALGDIVEAVAEGLGDFPF